MYYYYTLLIVFSVVLYMMTVDKNVGIYIILLTQLARINTLRLYYLIKFHPKNPITNYISNRKMDEMLKKMRDETDS